MGHPVLISRYIELICKLLPLHVSEIVCFRVSPDIGVVTPKVRSTYGTSCFLGRNEVLHQWLAVKLIPLGLHLRIRLKCKNEELLYPGILYQLVSYRLSVAATITVLQHLPLVP